MVSSCEQHCLTTIAYQLPDALARFHLLAEHLLCHECGEDEPLATPMVLHNAIRTIIDLLDQLRGEPGSNTELAGRIFRDTLAGFQSELVSFWGSETHQNGRAELGQCAPESHYEVCLHTLRQSPLNDATWQRIKEQFALFLDALPTPLNLVAQLSNLLAPIVHCTLDYTRAVDVESDPYDFAKKIQLELDNARHALLPHYSFLANLSCLITVWPMQINHAQAVHLHQYLQSAFNQYATADGEMVIAPVNDAGALAEPPEASPATPRWSKATGELFLGTILVRTVRGQSVAKTIVLILDAFEQAGWPPVIDNPFRKDYVRRRIDALRCLNTRLIKIKFHGAEENGRIRWRLR